MSIALLLAAGKGTRMRSVLPKPIVPFHEKPIVQHLIDAFHSAGINDIFLIVGHGADEVKATIGEGVQYILQKEQKGTAHAVMQARELIDWKEENVFVFVGDSPLIKAETIKELEQHHIQTEASCTFLTSIFSIKLPYARVIRDENHRVVACIEEKNASEEQLKIEELLSSHFIFKGIDLFNHLSEIQADTSNQEFYLTDIIAIFLSHKMKVEALCIKNYTELVGLNTPEEIQWAEQII